MSLKNLGLIAAFALCSSAGFAAAQTPASLRFDVTSIKPAVPLQEQIASGQLKALQQTITDSRLDINTMSLADLIAMAYAIKPYQLIAPEWMRTERYDVQATYPAGATKAQVPEMMQALLADRFQLRIHRDTKPLPAYALVVSKDGLKLPPASATVTPPPDDPKAQKLSIAGQDLQISSDSRGGQTITTTSAGSGPMRISAGADGVMRMEFSSASMTQYVEMLGQFVDKPVVDQTGLKGNYQIALELSQEDVMAMATARAAAAGISIPGLGGLGAAAGQAATPSSGASIFTTVQKQGLRLEARNLPILMVVVDSANKAPSEN